MKYIGLFLIGEGLASILYSKDQNNLSNLGRIVRIAIGLTELNKGV